MLEILAVKRVVQLVILLCPMTAGLSMFLDKSMEKGMIFRKYYNLICYYFWLPKKEEIRFDFKGLKLVIPDFTKNKYQWLFKVLGGCVYCFGTWVFIVFYLVVASNILTLIPLIIGLFLGIGMNYFWIEVIQRIKR